MNQTKANLNVYNFILILIYLMRYEQLITQLHAYELRKKKFKNQANQHKPELS
jgi:hypothetical protein